MIVSHVDEQHGVVTVKLSHSQLRIIQLLLSGKPIEDVVDRVNQTAGFEYINTNDVLVMARQFAFSVQHVVGTIDAKKAVAKATTPDYTVN